MDTLLAIESELDLSGRYEDGEYQSIPARVEELREELDPEQLGPLESDISRRVVEKWPRAERAPWLTSP